MDHQDPPAFGAVVQTLPSTCTDRPNATWPQKPQPSPAIRALISKLGLRFRPSASTDLEAHAATLALLASDIARAGITPADLDFAIDELALTTRFLPKPVEIIDLIRQHRQKSDQRQPLSAMELARRRNASGEVPRGMVWIARDDNLQLVSDRDYDLMTRKQDICTPEQAKAILAELAFGTPSAASQLKRHDGPAKSPTRADYIALGVDPGVL